MFAHYTTLNNHAEWRWRVYWSKQRQVERACKFIATLGGTTDDWWDSKTDLDLVSAWGNAPLNSSNAYLAIQAVRTGVYGLSVKRPKFTPHHGALMRDRLNAEPHQLPKLVHRCLRFESGCPLSCCPWNLPDCKDRRRWHSDDDCGDPCYHTDHGSLRTTLGAILGGTRTCVEP
ncbi:hypothetical protein BJ742DRAFT_254315 [Cladochytrium replicatum]|nr:hypothetical protein BJ742DRAFT_254315 [Cladochytrium replicatum]